MSLLDWFRPHPKPKPKGKKPKKPIPRRSKRYKPPTTAEYEWMKAIRHLPCCACGEYPRDSKGRIIPCEVHHITQGGRRLGHLFTIPLDHEHHEGRKLSIGSTKKTFIETYGTELELLYKVQQMVKKMGLLHD